MYKIRISRLCVRRTFKTGAIRFIDNTVRATVVCKLFRERFPESLDCFKSYLRRFLRVTFVLSL